MTTDNERLPIVLDIHVHLVPVVADRLAPISGVELHDGKLVVDGHRIGIEAIYKPDKLIAWMDDNRVEQALVSAPPPLYRAHLDRDAAGHWFDYVNDGLQEICANRSDRLQHLPHLPIEHPDLAVDIADRWKDKGGPGFAAGVGGACGKLLSDENLTALWANLNDQKSLLFLHPGQCCDGRLKDFYLENLLGNPHETSVAVGHLIFAGVPYAYPDIQFCLAHGGGNTAMMAARWQRGFDTNRPGIDPSLPTPETLLTRFFVDCIVHDAATLDLCRSVFGADKIMFGSDWPFPMGMPDPHGQTRTFDPAVRRQIFQDNPVVLRRGRTVV
jgi:aminocarboxymuconate-semialdehyde decarboxylase